MEERDYFARVKGFVADGYSAFSAHRCTTVAGTLAFFLLLSTAPFLFWLILLFGRRILDTAFFSETPLFGWAEELFVLLVENAESAGTGASAVLLFTTFFSSTSFFYHLRRSGELLYGVRRQRHGWKVRLSALLFTACLLLFFGAVGLIFVVFGIVSRFLFSWLTEILRYLLILGVGFLAAWLLNTYICPYRCKPSETALGSLLTALLWLLASAVFSVYLSFGSAERLYGALTLVVVFLLWVYWMMICFTAGVVFNRMRGERRRSCP